MNQRLVCSGEEVTYSLDKQDSEQTVWLGWLITTFIVSINRPYIKANLTCLLSSSFALFMFMRQCMKVLGNICFGL